ncbi:hypothetical protein G6F68_018387 [Rhizopus microsporus]|nr:hypothetical protein G6F68_018387 [Rhizopus microsporus]
MAPSTAQRPDGFAVGQAARADHVVACRLARRAVQHASQRVAADQVALRDAPRQRRIHIARTLGLVVGRDGDGAAIDDSLMLRVGQHIIAGQAVVAVGQGVTHVGVTVAGVGALVSDPADAWAAVLPS